jgi:hypothetical protein
MCWWWWSKGGTPSPYVDSVITCFQWFSACRDPQNRHNKGVIGQIRATKGVSGV